jgi:hypothetical protein
MVVTGDNAGICQRLALFRGNWQNCTHRDSEQQQLAHAPILARISSDRP